MIMLYTKLKLSESSLGLIYNGIRRVGLDKLIEDFKPLCNCNLVNPEELHITIRDTSATSIDHIKQALFPSSPSDADRLGLDIRSIEKWPAKYVNFHKEMPEKLCQKLLYIVSNIEFKIEDYSAHFGQFAVITLTATDNNRTISYIERNPHISIVKCRDENAQVCLDKIDKSTIAGYKSILDIGLSGKRIEVDRIEINADFYGESHSVIVSKNLDKCLKEKRLSKGPLESFEVGSGYNPFLNEKNRFLGLELEDDKATSKQELDAFGSTILGSAYNPPAIKPGKGYQKNGSGPVVAECFQSGSNFESQEGHAVIEFALSRRFSDIENILGVDITSSLSYEKYAISPVVSYAKKLKQTKYTLSSVFYSSYTLLTQIYEHKTLGEMVLTEYGKNIYDTFPEKFIQICGDHIITEVRMSAVFIANIKVNADSHSIMHKFKGNFSGKVSNIVEVMNEFSTIANTLGQSGSIEISLFQVGGNTSLLSHAFRHDENKQFYAVVCSFNNTNACMDTVSSILAYAQNFSSQIQNNPNSGLKTSFIKVPVRDFLFSKELRDYIINEEHDTNRKYLSQSYDKLTEYKENLGKIIANREVENHISRSTFKKLDEYYRKAESLIKTLEDADKGAIQCYKPNGDCSSIVSSFTKEFESINKAFIEKFGVAYNLSIEVSYGWITPFIYIVSYFYSLPASVLNVKMWPMEDNQTYLYSATPDLHATFDPRSAAMLSGKNNCSDFKKIGDYYSMEANSECLENWYPQCQYINCSGKVSLQEVDILD